MVSVMASIDYTKGFSTGGINVHVLQRHGKITFPGRGTTVSQLRGLGQKRTAYGRRYRYKSVSPRPRSSSRRGGDNTQNRCPLQQQNSQRTWISKTAGISTENEFRIGELKAAGSPAITKAPGTRRYHQTTRIRRNSNGPVRDTTNTGVYSNQKHPRIKGHHGILISSTTTKVERVPECCRWF
jgi:hypothetical protein